MQIYLPSNPHSHFVDLVKNYNKMLVNLLTFMIMLVNARKGMGPPPMGAKRLTEGWNTWNHLKGNINESIIKETADLFVSLGLKNAGYQYVNMYS